MMLNKYKIIQYILDNVSDAMHTMLITGYGKNDFLLTYHSDNNYNKSLLQIAKENKSKYFRFFDFT